MHGPGRGIQAIVVYPMNALANSQREELDKFLRRGFDSSEPPVTYARYTGQEGEEERKRIIQNPPDILLTNYVMLELILTRIEERELVRSASNLRFLVFDELHTYRGRQGADVSMLIRRCREAFKSDNLHCVGTSATMESSGTSEDQAAVVAKVASKIFGEEVPPSNVIGETLRRATDDIDLESPEVKKALGNLISKGSEAPAEYDQFKADPLASWIESTFGVRRELETGKLIRRQPQPLRGKSGAAAALAAIANTSIEESETAIERYLYGGSRCKQPENGFPVFAFRLHQFITRGDTAWASLETEDKREITLRGQRYVPGDRSRILLPLVFCRSCGQPYYRVYRPSDGRDGHVTPREDFGKGDSSEVEAGYLYFSSDEPWTGDEEDTLARVPEDWIEHRPNKPPRVKRGKPVPEVMTLDTGGGHDRDGLPVAFVRAPFQFCLNPKCGVAYNARQRSDLGKLSTLGVDGRSTATTVLALSTILKLRFDQSLAPKARKLLSFTDNRQDASLQSGHFNDFVEVGLIRSALYRAMSRLGGDGVRYDELVDHVVRAMDLPLHLYANDTELRGAALEETRRALKSVLTYFLYRDLEQGWRVTSPNLEKCGLLIFDYLSLDELASDQAYWVEKNAHGALVSATPQQRARIVRVLLDYLRRSLAIKHDSLSPEYQDRISEQSRQRLSGHWVIEEPREMVKAGIAWPRSRMDRERQEDVCISPQSNFGMFLKRPGVLPDLGQSLKTDDVGDIILDLFRCLKPFGLVEEVRSPREGSLVHGYQVPASVMIWKCGDGSREMHDELRVTRATDSDRSANEYFIQFYKGFAEVGAGLEGREHTAQVHAEDREQREMRFRQGELDVLFCSPTMELGVDIAQLNVVNMRNVPPTPANYAQRSGRAGRGGQPALVYTYCSGYSPHDQYYFKNPTRMVSGAVTAPRLDLLNPDLLRAHVHAVWLAEADLNLKQTLAEVLVVTEDNLDLPLNDVVHEKLNDATIKGRALTHARRLLASVGPELKTASWYREDWLDDVLRRIPQSFDEACNRWRSLYRAAVQHRREMNKVIGDHTRQQKDRDRAKSLRAQAESQLSLLTDAKNASEGDFYSYRYFASEGFLPGYNFPRLPLSAFIPARRGRRGRDEYLSRPRFLAISEFGPRAIIYHEGVHYCVNKVNLAFDEATEQLTQYVMKVCSSCGYGHLIQHGVGPDTCECCNSALLPTDEIRQLVRLQNVTAKPLKRISSDEEERQRIGYDIRSAFRFSEVNGEPDCRKAEVNVGERELATVVYGETATIWRVNMGWRQRKSDADRGFHLDVERGYWATNKAAEDSDREDPMSKRIVKVVPYVEDRRNALTVEFDTKHDIGVMASLQSAIKQGIQKVFQLEPSELAAQPLPSLDDRRLLFFYEAAEGGAGVLRQLAEAPEAMSRVARVALELCHFDPDTGDDLCDQADPKIECEAACYDCLLEYGNQPDHAHIDRKLIQPILLDLANSTTAISGSSNSRVDHFDALMRRTESGLERKWLQYVFDCKMKLPSHAQYRVPNLYVEPDFYYQDENTVIFIDGPPHDSPTVKETDAQNDHNLMNAGYLVLRFHHQASWDEIFDEYSDIFGRRTPTQSANA
ncbi:DEAD/DEAH box helicase domain-containing protein [Rhodopirellula sallentina SM41]|uniref:DEAD/DEAH box helicase domain-containing protein n=2 Tax=Rhodopirellula TaxID=265488 RepID=M5UIQ8_9BACT|nr:DEAD/DEAH box helicase domain-containing protein [Rhodopirellula sallentina SM41]